MAHCSLATTAAKSLNHMYSRSFWQMQQRYKLCYPVLSHLYRNSDISSPSVCWACSTDWDPISSLCADLRTEEIVTLGQDLMTAMLLYPATCSLATPRCSFLFFLYWFEDILLPRPYAFPLAFHAFWKIKTKAKMNRYINLKVLTITFVNEWKQKL